MPNSEAINIGDTVESRAKILDGLDFDVNDFGEPHIGIAAQFAVGELEVQDEIVAYFKSLNIPDRAIWTPESNIAGTDVIAKIVKIGVDTYIQQGLLPKGKKHNLYGEVISFDGVETLSNYDIYDDTFPHVDFVPSEIRSSVLFTASNGGPKVWQGSYVFMGNLLPSYETEAENMEAIEVGSGQILFSPDARTLLHSRSVNVTNKGRVLVRMFMGT